MHVIAHANHPEMFIAGLVVGALFMLAHFLVQRARK